MNEFEYTDKTKKLIDSFNSDIFKVGGYESPITGYMNNITQQIIEERDNAIVGTIREQFAIDVNREELIKALSYDRDQYNKGFSDGYREAQASYVRDKGEWIVQSYETSYMKLLSFKCSKCERVSSEPSKYCPDCGAEMNIDNQSEET